MPIHLPFNLFCMRKIYFLLTFFCFVLVGNSQSILSKNNLKSYSQVKISSLASFRTFSESSHKKAGSRDDVKSTATKKQARAAKERPKKSLSIYPNPINNKMHIRSQNLVESVVVYNLLGKIVIKTHPEKQSPTINTYRLKSGVYLVQIETSGASKSFKVVK